MPPLLLIAKHLPDRVIIEADEINGRVTEHEASQQRSELAREANR